jgi:DNA polymerase-1
MSKNRLVLIDGHAVIYRAFYAYPPLNAPSGELVNAVYGFTSIVLNVIRELQPTHIALAFDLSKPTFRHESFANYKANRAETPVELTQQIDRVREVVETFNIPVFTKEGFEADDVIGTICDQVTRKNASDDTTEVVIVTGDKDAFQLVVDSDAYGSVGVYIPGRNKFPSTLYDEAEVAQKFEGLTPLQVIDLKGLAGDQSDNIPGVKGIGNKTAIKLLLKYKTVEGVYEAIDARLNHMDQSDVSAIAKDMGVGKSVVEKLLSGRESAFQSKQLATIIRDVPLDFMIEKAVINDYDKKKVLALFSELGFTSLTHKLPNDLAEQNIQEALF